MAEQENRTQTWLQIAAIIIGLTIHGSLIGYQLGKLTQLVSGIETRLVANEGAMRICEKDLTTHKLFHPDRDLDKRISALEQGAGD